MVDSGQLHISSTQLHHNHQGGDLAGDSTQRDIGQVQTLEFTNCRGRGASPAVDIRTEETSWEV